MARITAVREFGPNGYNWHPQVWVETLQQWADVRSVRFKHPQGFAIANEAIAAARLDITGSDAP